MMPGDRKGVLDRCGVVTEIESKVLARGESSINYPSSRGKAAVTRYTKAVHQNTGRVEQRQGRGEVPPVPPKPFLVADLVGFRYVKRWGGAKWLGGRRGAGTREKRKSPRRGFVTGVLSYGTSSGRRVREAETEVACK